MDVGGGYCKSVLCSTDMLVENLEPRTQNSQDLQIARQSCTQPYPQPLRERSVKAVYLLMAREKLVEVFYVILLFAEGCWLGKYAPASGTLTTNGSFYLGT